MSVECKNVRENFPLVIHAVERRAGEAFQDVISFRGLPADWAHGRRLTDPQVYRQAERVGKKMGQVGRANDNTIEAADNLVFEKMTQALNSAYDLIKEAASYNQQKAVHAVVPCLVVPDKRLWCVSYSEDGQHDDPIRVDDISYFVGREWKIDRTSAGFELSFTISHIEIISLSALKQRTDALGKIVCS